MCVIAWAWRVHPRYPLAVLANRDESHARASAPLDWWTDAPALLAGRDLEAGGTWLGVTRSGRFAAVTNRPGPKPPAAPSRGDLTREFLLASANTDAAIAALAPKAERYAGFNLLLGDGETLAFGSNREANREPTPGIHGMANGALDEAAPKVAELTTLLDAWCETGDEPQPDDWLARLGDDADAVFVRGAEYGTRSSSVVIFGADRSVRFIERSYDAAGRALGTAAFDFGIES
ncbi:MAG: NRDE family protein [Gammaproteobacteria bacterium]